ncbi:MAG: hypothetical protein RIR33_2621 [Pseudomonadota bacterium]|jgi:hypothetical protein
MEALEYAAGTEKPARLNADFAAVFEATGGWKQVRDKLPKGQKLPADAALPLTIKTGKSGFGAETATVIVAAIAALSPVVQKIVLDLWTEVWLPALRKEKGRSAIGRRKK